METKKSYHHNKTDKKRETDKKEERLLDTNIRQTDRQTNRQTERTDRRARS